MGGMSKAGCPYDNSCMESFFASLKKEYFYRREYATIDDVRRDLFYYHSIIKGDNHGKEKISICLSGMRI